MWFRFGRREPTGFAFGPRRVQSDVLPARHPNFLKQRSAFVHIGIVLDEDVKWLGGTYEYGTEGNYCGHRHDLFIAIELAGRRQAGGYHLQGAL